MQFKALVRYPIDIRRAKRLLAGRAASPPLPQRPIALDLRTTQLLFDCARHFGCLAYHARAAGSPFYVRCAPMTLACVARKFLGRRFLSEPHVRWLPPGDSLPENAVVLCDYDPDTGDPLVQRNGVQMMIGRDIDRSVPVMPYTMNPLTLYELENVNLRSLRATQSRRGIFFAGNQQRRYGYPKLKDNFGVMSRLEVLGILAENFPSRVVTSMQRATEQSIVIANGEEPIASSDWLATTAQARFFMCCPGASQPMCHNLVEAMSVGTIPILEYADRVTPELRDGENAICFSGERGLIDAINRVDRMTPDELASMSNAAAEFYDRHLCVTKFSADLRDGRLDLSSRRICMPFHEVNFYENVSTPISKAA